MKFEKNAKLETKLAIRKENLLGFCGLRLQTPPVSRGVGGFAS